MSNHNVKITITDTILLPLQSPNDQYVMNLDRLKGYSPRQQLDINLTRIYLQITTLAEMSDRTSPANISLWALQGERPADFVSKDAWPRQLPPSRHQQRLWKRYISSQFLRYDRKWRAIPTLISTGRDTPDPIQPINSQQSRPLMSYLKGLPRNKKRLLTHIQFPEHEDRIWRECQRKQTLTIASDGGLKGRQGTFG
ncbi:hypothetical protein MHU86_19703 [Fragilaria crotonensis]|nr:hypothetical protein MHU86_19703 [Fragilaria crotonensis]